MKLPLKYRLVENNSSRYTYDKNEEAFFYSGEQLNPKKEFKRLVFLKISPFPCLSERSHYPLSTLNAGTQYAKRAESNFEILSFKRFDRIRVRSQENRNSAPRIASNSSKLQYSAYP
uniref:Uncharacterized protein n=1 Tax=Megaselia scalaris TaxID=36166 RepID=T1GEG9_MEGSC